MVGEAYSVLMARRGYASATRIIHPLGALSIKLMTFTMSDTFAARAADMAGYDVSGLGKVL